MEKRLQLQIIKMTRLSVFAILLFIAMIVGISCVEADENSVLDITSPVSAMGPDTYKILGEYFVNPSGNTYASHVVVIKNNSEEPRDFKIHYKYYNEAGALVAEDKRTIWAVDPGCVSYYHYLINVKEKNVSSWETVVNDSVSGNSFFPILEDLSTTWEISGNEALVTVTNTGNRRAEFPQGIMLFFDGDKLVDIDDGIFTAKDQILPAGESAVDKLAARDRKKFDRVEFYLNCYSREAKKSHDTAPESVAASASANGKEKTLSSAGDRYKDPLSGITFVVPKGMKETNSITEEHKSGAGFSTALSSFTFLCLDRWSDLNYYKEDVAREEVDNTYFLAGLTIALDGNNLFNIKKETISGQTYFIYPQKTESDKKIPYQDFIKKYCAVCMRDGYLLKFILVQFTTDEKETHDSLTEILKTVYYPMGVSSESGSIHNIVKCYPSLPALFSFLILLFFVFVGRGKKQKGKNQKLHRKNRLTKSVVFQNLRTVLSEYKLLNSYSGPLLTSIIGVFVFVVVSKLFNGKWLTAGFLIGCSIGETLFANLSDFLREREKELQR